MNGLWYPPVRLLKSIRILKDGIHPVVSQFETRPDSRIFRLEGCSIEMSMPDDHLILLRSSCSGQAQYVLELELGPISVWFSDWEPSWSTYVTDRRVSIDFSNPALKFSVLPFNTTLSLLPGKVSAPLSEGSAVLITATENPEEPNSPATIVSSARSTHLDVLSSTMLDCSNSEIDDAFYWSKLNLSWLMHDQPGIGRGITAGHPEFPWYFGLDTFYCLDAMLETGQHDGARGSLELLARYARAQCGRIPHEIVTNGRVYNPGDLEESAMFPSALLSYLQWTGDERFAIEHLGDALNALRYVVSQEMVGPGAMEDSERGRAQEIDTMCHFVEGSQSLSAILRILGAEERVSPAPLDEIYKLSAETRRYVEREMWLPELGTFANRVVDGVPVFKGHWTSISPFAAGIASASQYRRFVSEDGGLGMLESGEGLMVDGKGSSSMPVLNGLMAIAAAAFGDIDTSIRFYMRNIARVGEFMPCAIPEIAGSPDGCYLQAWSSAMVIHPLLRGLVGLRVENGLPVCSPVLKEPAVGCVTIRRLQVRGSLFDVVASAGTTGGAEITVSSPESL